MTSGLDTGTAASLKKLDQHLRVIWELGRNAVVAWAPTRTGLELVVMETAGLLQSLADHPALLRGTRYRDAAGLREVAALPGAQAIPVEIGLRIGVQKGEVPWQTLERIIRRFSINETAYRGAVLFDIVGFSRLTPVQQIAQLHALEYAINVAEQTMRASGADVDFARSTTGDGFYTWNRRTGFLSDLNLLVLMVLALAENDHARSLRVRGGNGDGALVPRLRSVYSIGRHLSYYQIENLAPRGYEYIVGDVTIALARLMVHTAPDCIVVGDFVRPLRDDGDDPAEVLGTAEFISRCNRLLPRFTGLEVAKKRVTSIEIALLGSKGEGAAPIRVEDKHGFIHAGYGMTAAIRRGNSIPLFLGGDPPPVT